MGEKHAICNVKDIDRESMVGGCWMVIRFLKLFLREWKYGVCRGVWGCVGRVYQESNELLVSLKYHAGKYSSMFLIGPCENVVALRERAIWLWQFDDKVFYGASRSLDFTAMPSRQFLWGMLTYSVGLNNILNRAT
ncbi:hypothetical protein M0804_012052 [Polistes exclamans]|nr:hypothetical protein M0804_012052 [Polistes exclamans]